MAFKKYIPNMMTYSNLLLGTAAIVIVVAKSTDSSGVTVIAASLLLIAAVWLDRYDGKIARLFEVESEFGKQLDSLADLVSFGIAPVTITWKACLFIMGPVGTIPVLIFSICSATRLARYNVSNYTNEYVGVPITVAGGLLALVNLFSYLLLNEKMTSQVYIMLISLFILILSYAMISNIKIKKM